MKKLFYLLMIACTCLVGTAQDNFLFSIHAVQVEGDLEAFEKVESMYMQRVAQAAVDKGDIMGWSFNKSVHLDNINDEGKFNYIFLQFAPDIESMIGEQANWWNHAGKVLSKKEQEEVAELQKKFTWKKDVRVMYKVEDRLSEDYEGLVAFQFNFAKPKNTAGFVEENKTLWKSFFQQNMKKMNLIGWGVATKIHPSGADWSDVMTWDVFKNLTDLYKSRIGIDGLTYPQGESKMNEYNPDGFSERPIYVGVATTKTK